MALVDDLPYRPFLERGHVVDGEFRWRLGARPLDLSQWFEMGSDGCAWVDEKPRIMDEHGDVAFAVLDGVDAECAEVADAVANHVGVPLDSRLHPLDAAARLVPDDLVVMVERSGRLVFGGGSVCFPNRWDLRSKLGLTMREVHEPVAGLNDQLGDAVDDFLARLSPERSFWRLGWGIIDSPSGYEPPVTDTRRVPSSDPANLWVRVERETLRRLPATQCVLFGIRTYVSPLVGITGDLDASDAIATIVAAMPELVREYKDLDAIGDEIVADLSARRA